MSELVDQERLPAALPLPVTISVRNADSGLNESGRAGRLDPTGLVATLPSEIKPGTVLFTSIDMRSLNATARGLVRVRNQRSLGEDAGFETFAEFVELSDENRQKVERLMSTSQSPEPAPAVARDFAMEQLEMQSSYRKTAPAASAMQITSTTKSSYYEPAPLRPKAQATRGTKFWQSLGVTAYVAAFLVLVALFPAGRAIELAIWAKAAWAFERLWFWTNHIGQVKLYDNQ